MKRKPCVKKGRTCCIMETELLKVQKSGQFPDDPTKIEGVQRLVSKRVRVLSTKNASCVSHVVGKKLSNKAFGNLIIRPLPHTTQRKMDPQQIHLHGVCVSTLAHPFDVIRMDFPILFVYYETIKREVNKRLIYECRCDERLKAKAEGSTCLASTIFLLISTGRRCHAREVNIYFFVLSL